MANATRAEIDAALAALQEQATRNTDAETAATALVNGFAARIDAAVAKAIADNPGVTAEQLAGVTAETAAMRASADALGAAVVANTPAA